VQRHLKPAMSTPPVGKRRLSILARPAAVIPVARGSSRGANSSTASNTTPGSGRRNSSPSANASAHSGPRRGAGHRSSASHIDASCSARGVKRGIDCLASDLDAGSGAYQGTGNCGRAPADDVARVARNIDAALEAPPRPLVSATLDAHHQELLRQIVQACNAEPGHIQPLWRLLQERQKRRRMAALPDVGASGKHQEQGPDAAGPRAEPVWLSKAAEDCATSVVEQLSRGIPAVTLKQRDLRKEFRCSSEGAAAIQAKTTVILEAQGIMQRRSSWHSRQHEYYRLQLADCALPS